MRIPKALSFTALKTYLASEDQFYLERLCDTKLPRVLQNKPFAVGSAFDILVKARLLGVLAGERQDIEALFDKQVDPPHREWAKVAGEVALQAYIASGAYDNLLSLLIQSDSLPRFEFDLSGIVGGVPFFGRPDLQFNWHGLSTVADWKVKGYCSKASPSKGYMLCLDSWKAEKQSKSHGKSHKLFEPCDWEGLPISCRYLEENNKDYGMQLSIYSWLLGAEPGCEDFVIAIEELCGPSDKIRVASHRARVSKAFQLDVLDKAQCCWNAITSGHYFHKLTRQESQDRCEHLEAVARAWNAPCPGREAQLASIEATYGVAA